MNVTIETGSRLFDRVPTYTADKRLYGIRFRPKNFEKGDRSNTLVRNFAVKPPKKVVHYVIEDGKLQTITIKESEQGLSLKQKEQSESNFNANALNSFKPIQDIKKLGHDWEVVYIVGNGPGLADNWEHLKNRKRGVVLACNRALNIIPTEFVDFWMTVDPFSPLNYVNKSDCSKTIGLVDLATDPGFHDAGFKDVYSFNSFFSLNVPKWNNQRAWTLEAAYSVTFPMIHLAWIMGAKQIIFVGQDCAFADGEGEDKIHSGVVDETTEKKARERAEQETIRVPGIGGKVYSTFKSFALIAEIILSACFFLSVKTVFCFNASERGILSGTVNHNKMIGEKGSREYVRQRLQLIEQVKLKDIISRMNKLPRGDAPRREWSLYK